MKIEVRIEVENQEDFEEGLEGLREFLRQEVKHALVNLLKEYKKDIDPKTH